MNLDKYPNRTEWLKDIPDAHIEMAEKGRADMDGVELALHVVDTHTALCNASKNNMKKRANTYAALLLHLVIRLHMGILDVFSAEVAKYFIKEDLGYTIEESAKYMGCDINDEGE